jgi:hypothetical protein
VRLNLVDSVRDAVTTAFTSRHVAGVRFEIDGESGDAQLVTLQSAFKALGGIGSDGLTFRDPTGNVEAVSWVYATGGAIQTDEVTGNDAFDAAPGEDEFVRADTIPRKRARRR